MVKFCVLTWNHKTVFLIFSVATESVFHLVTQMLLENIELNMPLCRLHLKKNNYNYKVPLKLQLKLFRSLETLEEFVCAISVFFSIWETKIPPYFFDIVNLFFIQHTQSHFSILKWHIFLIHSRWNFMSSSKSGLHYRNLWLRSCRDPGRAKSCSDGWNILSAVRGIYSCPSY